jgi:hypothetical protein
MVNKIPHVTMEKTDVPEAIGSGKKASSGASRPLVWTVIATIIIVLVLALGLGLGLGLKHRKSGSASTQTSNGTASNSSGLTQNYPSWRRDPSEYNLDMGWDVNGAPTTRVFNLTVSEIQAAPDGKSMALSPFNMWLTSCN